MGLTELDVSSNKVVGGVAYSLVSALPLTQMRCLPLNSCSLNHESFTALGTLTQRLLELLVQLPALQLTRVCVCVCLSSGRATPAQRGRLLV